MPRLYRQISYGIDEIIQKCGADIHTKEDWETIFLLLKTAGAGLILEKTVSDEANVQSETAENDGDNISIATSERFRFYIYRYIGSWIFITNSHHSKSVIVI